MSVSSHTHPCHQPLAAAPPSPTLTEAPVLGISRTRRHPVRGLLSLALFFTQHDVLRSLHGGAEPVL